jgi:hypothetical protein
VTTHKSQSGIGSVIRKSPEPKNEITNQLHHGTQSANQELEMDARMARISKGLPVKGA